VGGAEWLAGLAASGAYVASTSQTCSMARTCDIVPPRAQADPAPMSRIATAAAAIPIA
jgi:hypothetical protein